MVNCDSLFSVLKVITTLCNNYFYIAFSVHLYGSHFTHHGLNISSLPARKGKIVTLTLSQPHLDIELRCSTGKKQPKILTFGNEKMGKTPLPKALHLEGSQASFAVF